LFLREHEGSLQRGASNCIVQYSGARGHRRFPFDKKRKWRMSIGLAHHGPLFCIEHQSPPRSITIESSDKVALSESDPIAAARGVLARTFGTDWAEDVQLVLLDPDAGCDIHEADSVNGRL